MVAPQTWYRPDFIAILAVGDLLEWACDDCPSNGVGQTGMFDHYATTGHEWCSTAAKGL